MSGFNTKERNNYGEYEIAFYTDNHEDFKKVQDLCRKLIDHDKPVSTEGDLISRSYLKQMMPAPIEDEYKRVHQIIDNAPTVAVNCKDCDGYEAGYSAGLKDAERPKGDLISREALKEDIVKLCRQINASNGITVPTLAFTRIIDNAPTVEPCYQTTSCLDCKNYDKETHNCPRFCEVIKEAINSRPQGEKGGAE